MKSTYECCATPKLTLRKCQIQRELWLYICVLFSTLELMLVQHRTTRLSFGTSCQINISRSEFNLFFFLLLRSYLKKTKKTCFILDCYREYEYEGAMKFKFNQLPNAGEKQGCQTTYFEGHVNRSFWFNCFVLQYLFSLAFPVYPSFRPTLIFFFCVSRVYLPSFSYEAKVPWDELTH